MRDMRRIKTNHKFHGIEQGLFYSGNIHKNPSKEDSNSVYDCGLKKINVVLERQKVCGNYQSHNKRHLYYLICLFS